MEGLDEPESDDELPDDELLELLSLSGDEPDAAGSLSDKGVAAEEQFVIAACRAMSGPIHALRLLSSLELPVCAAASRRRRCSASSRKARCRASHACRRPRDHHHLGLSLIKASSSCCLNRR